MSFRIGGLVAIFILLLAGACHAANPPICPHVIGWNSTIATWAQGAPWVKVIYSGDVAPAKAVGAKVFYRPWDADSANHDDACLPASLTGTQYADLVWAKMSPMASKPDAVSYRNEFNWTDPDGSMRTCAEFPGYAARLRALGYAGKIIFGSFGVGWVDGYVWDKPELIDAVNASDGVETHEYFDFEVNCGAPWLAFRHRDIALAEHPYLQSKDWYIGEFGSDRVCNPNMPCSDLLCRRGWRDAGKLTEQAYIDQMAIYRAGCANQVKAVFVFQQGDSGPWADFEVLGTNVAEWMRSTWGLPSGRFVGTVKDASGRAIPYPSISVTPGLYTAAGTSGGGYNTPFIPVGTYSVTASKTGYAPQTQAGKVITSGGVNIVYFVLSPVTTVAEAKKQADYTTAVVSGIVTAKLPPGGSERIYVQDPNLPSGIAVLPASSASPADIVQVQGTIYRDPNGERVIKDATVTTTSTGQPLPKALGLNNLWLGGGQFLGQAPVVNHASTDEYAKGLSNIGLLVHAWGRVSYVDPSGAFFYLNDGSGLDDGSTHAGVRVAISGLPMPASGADVDVIGISSTTMIGGKIVRLLRPRSVADLSYASASNYLANPGFESAMSDWTSYGRTDGVQSGTWFGSATPHSGSYFFGSAANYDAKAGGVYQRVMAIRDGSYEAKAWSRVFWNGNSPDSVRNRVGIDPTGGTNPAGATVAWSPIDTQPNPDTSSWKQLTTPTVTCATGLVTIFLDFTQTNPAGWHVNSFDDAEVRLVR